MRQTITQSKQNLQYLQQLITDETYIGFANAKRFELSRHTFPCNYKVIGLLNDSGTVYHVSAVYKTPLEIAARVLFTVGIVISIISMFIGNWILFGIIFSFGFIIFLIFKVQQKKEIQMLTSALLQLHTTSIKS